jgi:gluconate 2-dehydrogenase gamma chain
VTNQPFDRSTGQRSIDRRQLLRNTSIAAGGAAVAGLALPDLSGAAPVSTSKPVIKLHQTASPVASPAAVAPVDLENYSPVALTDAELATVKAATDRIIPADDLGPSASEAGVFVYIDRALSGRYAAQLPLYQESLVALNAASEGGDFAALDPGKQDEILSMIETNEIKEFPQGFWMMLLTHTREGLFADPIYGGNQNFSGWDLIGYTGIRLLWTAEDQAIDYLPEPEHVSVAEYGGEA